MFCTNCGHEIAEGSAFCTNCGKPVAQASPAPTPAPAEPSVSEQPEPVAPPAESSIPTVSPAEPPAPQAETPAPEPSEPAVVAPQDGPAVDDAPTTCLTADGGAGETPVAEPAAPSPMPEPAPSEPAPFQAEPPAAPPVDNSPQVEPDFSPDTAATQQVPAWQQGASDVQPQPVPWSAQQPGATMPGVSTGETQVAPGPAPASGAMPGPVPGPADAPAGAPAAEAAPAPDLFNEQPKKKRSTGKTVGIAVAVLAVVAVLCVAGYFVYTTFFSTSPEEIIAADLEEHLSFYEDPEAGEGDRLLSEADSVLSGLGAYCYPDDEAYTSWLDETSFEVGDVTIAEDGETATATATITHMPLISYVEEYMGETDDAGEEQESELSVTYQRSGSEWSVDSIDLQQAVFDAYLPTDEELILSDVYWYFGDVDSINDEFILGLEAGAGSDLDQLGITAEEFAEAFLDGFNYEVGDVTVDGDVATVDVTITSKSMDEISTEFQNRFTEWASTVDPSTITSENDLYKQGGQIFLEVTREAEAADHQVELTFTQDSSGVWWMDTASEDDLMGTMGV